MNPQPNPNTDSVLVAGFPSDPSHPIRTMMGPDWKPYTNSQERKCHFCPTLLIVGPASCKVLDSNPKAHLVCPACLVSFSSDTQPLDVHLIPLTQKKMGE